MTSTAPLHMLSVIDLTANDVLRVWGFALAGSQHAVHLVMMRVWSVAVGVAATRVLQEMPIILAIIGDGYDG